MLETITEKVCTKCGKTKPISEFNVKNDSPDGYQYHCKDCKREYQLKRKFIEKTDIGYKKQCVHCGEWKAGIDFYFKSNTPDKLQPWCKKCTNEYNEKRMAKHTDLVTEKPCVGIRSSKCLKETYQGEIGNCRIVVTGEEKRYFIYGTEITIEDIDDMKQIAELRK